MKSIIPQAENCCWLCCQNSNYWQYRKGERHEHHIFYGTANRSISERWGLKVWLCWRHHEELHDKPNEGFDLELKEYAQRFFEKKYSHELFMQEFGKSWL